MHNNHILSIEVRIIPETLPV